MPVDDYYRVLSIPQNASSEDIKHAYHRLVLQCHPDIHSMIPDAEARLRRIIEAHKVLADPVSRAQYDRTLAQSSPMWHFKARPEGLARTIAKRRICAIKALIFTVVIAALIVHIGLVFNNRQPTPIDWEQHPIPGVSLIPAAISAERSAPDHAWALWCDQFEVTAGDYCISLDHSTAFSTAQCLEDLYK